MRIPPGRTRILAAGLDHPEDVAWAADGNLYAGGEDGQVYRIAPDGSGAEVIAHLRGRFLLGVTAHPDGSLLLCDSTRGEVLRLDIETRKTAIWTASASGQPLRCPNYLSLLPDGSAVLTDSGDIDAPNGCLVHVPAKGGEGVRLSIGPMYYPNGCALLDDDG